jgi:hypothetical protein
MSASIIARPDWVRTFEATEVSLIPASCSTFSSRWISAARASLWVLRYRVSSRSSRIGSGGTKLGRIIPCAATSASHSASVRSVLRPGTFLTARALHSHAVNRDSSAYKTGFQYTPVASIATSSTRRSASHPASSARPDVVVANRSFSRTTPALGPSVRTHATTLSRCTSSPATRS